MRIVFNSEAEFLALFSQYKNKIAAGIADTFKNVTNPNHRPMSEGSRFRLVDSAKMDNWDAALYSVSLTALAQKINHMVNEIGDPSAVMPMLQSIASNKLKKLTQPHRDEDGDFLGYGHFRWNYQAYQLVEFELQFIRDYLSGNA